MSQTEGYVKHSTENFITTIEFYHPASNSLPGTILEQLAQTIKSFNNHPEIHVIILKSAGSKAFCAGASFDELVAISNEKEGLKFFSGFAQVINAIRQCTKMVIGVIQGKAVGGGVGLAAACDYCIAHSSASIKLSELAVGIGPFVVGPAVERKIGKSCFTQLTLDATEWRTAQWALRRGLYAEVYDKQEDVENAVDKLAQFLSKSSPDALREIKKINWQGTENWDTLLTERAAISGKLVLSDFTKKAIQKFKSK